MWSLPLAFLGFDERMASLTCSTVITGQQHDAAAEWAAESMERTTLAARGHAHLTSHDRALTDMYSFMETTAVWLARISLSHLG